MQFVFPPHPDTAIPIANLLFPVHRIYWVSRNYAEHAKETGGTGRMAQFN